MSAAHAARALMDVETEEVLHVAFPRVRRHRQPFTLLFGDALLALLRTEGRSADLEEAMRPVHWRVLLYLLASMGYENRLERYVSEIADDLDNDRSTVSKALQSLEDRELIYIEPRRSGRPTVIHVHPALAFRGKPGQRAAVLATTWPDLTLPPSLR